MSQLAPELTAELLYQDAGSELCDGSATACSSTQDTLRRLGIDSVSKIIEFDVDTPAVARSLIAAGYSNYLGIARDSRRLGELRDAAPNMAHLFQLMHSPSEIHQLSQNNADLVILSGDAPNYLHNALYVKHFRAVIWRLRSLWQFNSSMFWASYKRIRRQVGPLQTMRFSCSPASASMYCAVRRLHVKPPVRRFIGNTDSLPRLFQALDEASVKYVVLRWFEHLPSVDPREDVDLLVADQDLPTYSRIVDATPGIIPCDVYTPSGLPGTRYHDLAYYPRQVAKELLENRVCHSGGFYTPSLEHHFLSLAYHAVYHKGEDSGLPFGNEDRTNERQPYHTYRENLMQLAAQLGLHIELSLFSLHMMLQQRGWTPEVDTLRKLSLTNPWIASILPDHSQDPKHGELLIFVVREWATSRNLTSQIASWLQDHGLQIIMTRELSPLEQALARRLRGGVWEDGAVDVGRASGGNPKAVVVAFDRHPEPPRTEDRVKFPHVKNAKVFLKHQLRREFQPDVSPEQLVNFVHSADDEFEAWDYLRLSCPGVVEEVRERVTELRRTMIRVE